MVKPTLTLPPSLFLPSSSSPLPPKRLYPTSIIDTHVHLWTSNQLNQGLITWPEREGLGYEHGIQFYSYVSRRGSEMFLEGSGVEGGNKEGEKGLEGFIFVQAENIHDDTDLDGSKGGWGGGLAEFEAVCNAVGTVGEGETKLLGIVAWAPVHLGAVSLSLYHSQITSIPLINSNHSLLKSYRYLLQDSPPGFLLQSKFIEGLKWLGKNTNGVFDLTVDVTKQGVGAKVLEEVVDCIRRVREGQEIGKETRFVIDHFAKPDLKSEPTIPPSKEYQLYIKSLFQLALFPEVVLKLSALLSSCEPTLVKEAFKENCLLSASTTSNSTHDLNSEHKNESAIAQIESQILNYLEPALESFGDSRILIGSDFPMFRIILSDLSATSVPSLENGREVELELEARAWEFQFRLYNRCLGRIGVEGDGLDRIFSGNAKRVYEL